MRPTQPSSSSIPHIHALCMNDQHCTVLKEALSTHGLPDSMSITYHDCALSFVPPSCQFDLIVSPANSYGRLDGGFDDAISRAFSPRDDYLALTRAAQAKLYEEWRGFAPPGTCTLLRIPPEYHNSGHSKNVWGTKYLALTPTMRVPHDVTWDREIVYECMWSLLCAIDKHNQEVRKGKNGQGDDNDEIKSFLLVPAATGCGHVSAAKWANQTALAIKHYIDAVEHPEKWKSLQLAEIFEYADATALTWPL